MEPSRPVPAFPRAASAFLASSLDGCFEAEIVALSASDARFLVRLDSALFGVVALPNRCPDDALLADDPDQGHDHQHRQGDQQKF
jgi:hypothetical protein